MCDKAGGAVTFYDITMHVLLHDQAPEVETADVSKMCDRALI